MTVEEHSRCSRRHIASQIGSVDELDEAAIACIAQCGLEFIYRHCVLADVEEG